MKSDEGLIEIFDLVADRVAHADNIHGMELDVPTVSGVYPQAAQNHLEGARIRLEWRTTYAFMLGCELAEVEVAALTETRERQLDEWLDVAAVAIKAIRALRSKS